MRLRQFLSSVFPRLLRTKLEQNRQSNVADQNTALLNTDSNSRVVSSDIKHAFDTVDQSHGYDSSDIRSVAANDDCGSPLSFQGGAGYGLHDWGSVQYEDNRIGVSVSRSRSMIRTNPWLASPKSTHSESVQSQTGSTLISLSLPTTPTTCSIGSTMEHRQALAGRELGLLLLVPANSDDSASEGYVSSVFRSPSVTDMDSFEGGIDSALASSVSSESDFEWRTSVAPNHSTFHAASTHGDEVVGLQRTAAAETTKEVVRDASFKADGHHLGSKDSYKEELPKEKLQHKEDVSIQKNKGELGSDRSSNIKSGESQSELKLAKCECPSDFLSSESNRSYSSSIHCEGPVNFENVKQHRTGELRRSLSSKTSTDRTTEGDSDERERDEEKQLISDKADGDNASSRSLNEVSESLQDKVRRLHDQKQYVDAMFHRAREADRQRASQFAKFRSQFVAAKRQALLRKLQELQTMLGSQSTRLQMVYDTVLSVQWPKVLIVRQMGSTNQ